MNKFQKNKDCNCWFCDPHFNTDEFFDKLELVYKRVNFEDKLTFNIQIIDQLLCEELYE